PARLADSAPARLADGTLAGSTVTMDASVRLAVRHCGVSLEQALRSAASVPATLLGLQDRGVIARGRRADLVALDPDLRVKEVWVGGEQAWPATAGR
ncbi:MAG: amidohydrolase family protein, partial [Actinobacteria bacterium]|nr:amidohydrolase family protein [Actinomycetota bacterium]